MFIWLQKRAARYTSRFKKLLSGKIRKCIDSLVLIVEAVDEIDKMLCAFTATDFYGIGGEGRMMSQGESKGRSK